MRQEANNSDAPCRSSRGPDGRTPEAQFVAMVTDTLYDVIPGRRVGSPKPNKNRPDRPVPLQKTVVERKRKSQARWYEKGVTEDRKQE